MRYFGLWTDPDGAPEKYLAEKDALHAGKAPEQEIVALTVKAVANAFMRIKQQAVDAGELSPHTWADYLSIMTKMLAKFSKQRLVADLGAEDFAALKSKLAKKNGPPRMSTIIQAVRCAFKQPTKPG
jgi:hypothetical protein